MAKSGSVKKAITNYDDLIFNWSIASQSAVKNESVVNWEVKLVSGAYGAIGSSANKPWSATINGTTTSGNARIDIGNNSSKTIASGSITIPHNADGTKSFNFNFTITIAITWGGTYIGAVSLSGIGVLDAISRASLIACADGYIGETTHISVRAGNQNYRHNISYNFLGATGIVVEDSKGSAGYDWTIPTSFYSKIPMQTFSNCALTCDTYYNGVLIGSHSINIIVYVDAAKAKPIVTATVYDSNATTAALTGDANSYVVRYASDMAYTINATSSSGATIKHQSARCGSNTISSATGVLEGAESGSITFTAIDSRSISTAYTVERTLIEYIPLTCNLNVETPTTDGKAALTISGNYFSGSFGAANNSIALYMRLKANNEEFTEWVEVQGTITVKNNTYTITITVTDLDYKNSYTFEARAVDKVQTVDSAAKKVKTVPVFDWGNEDFNFNVPVMMNGGTVLRHNASANNLVVSATGGFIYMRPKGTNNTLGEIRITPQGNIEMDGDIIIDGVNIIQALKDADII